MAQKTTSIKPFHHPVDLTKQELETRICRLETNKMPGADGYPAECCKTFREITSPILINTIFLQTSHYVRHTKDQ